MAAEEVVHENISGHDKTVQGVLSFVEKKFFPPLGHGSEATKGKRHAANMPAALGNVQQNMERLKISEPAKRVVYDKYCDFILYDDAVALIFSPCFY